MLIAGDTIIDWIIQDEEKTKATPVVGGAGNIVRGLQERGHDVSFLTVYNPALYPLGHTFDLHPNTLTDFQHTNVFVRDYGLNVHHRFRENLKKNVLDVNSAHAVICHEDSVIRRFKAFYADVRDGSVRGEAKILRMSSSDPTDLIRTKVKHEWAIITYKDKVEVFKGNGDYKTTIEFDSVTAVDDIGAGDTFNVGFLDYVGDNLSMDWPWLQDAILTGVELAQEKVQKVGVFL